MTVLCVEATPKVGGQPIRVASEPYMHPTAPGPFFDRLSGGSRIRREIFADGLAYGAGSNDYGVVELHNADGFCDWLENDGVDAYGGSLSLWVLPSPSSPWSARRSLFSGRLGTPQVGDVVSLRVLDDFALALDKQIAGRRWLGTNVGATGLEGGTELKDQWYPVLEGRAFNCPAPWASSSSLILCVADKAVSAILLDAVEDNGSPLTRGTARATLADLQATTPAAGKWDYFLGDATTPAYVRLGSTPAGTVRVTARSGGGAADRTGAQIWRRVLVSRAGVDPATISAADVTALDAQQPAELGWWVDGNGSVIRDLLDLTASSMGAGYWRDRAGLWRIARVDLPSGDPVCCLTVLGLDRPGRLNDIDIISIEPVFTSRADGGRPFDLTRLRYARNYGVADKSSLAGVALDRADRLSKEWLDTAYPASVTAPENEYSADTAFATASDATTEAQRRHGLGGARRRRHDITVILTPELADTLDLNAVVRVEHPRYGFASAPLARVSALEIDLLSLETKITVWR